MGISVALKYSSISSELTYMATVEHLVAVGKLKKHVPDLDDDELPERLALLSPEFEAWAQTELKPCPCLGGRFVTPFEQAEQILYEFVVGRPMAYSVHYRKLDPIGLHVWELKTPDVRIFGWFPRKCHFIAVCGELKNRIRRAKDYAPYIQRVLDFRVQLDLDEPKALTGVNHNDIL